MSSVQPASTTPSHYQPTSPPSAVKSASGMQPAAQHTDAETQKTPANKAVSDMVSLLDEAARHPESLQDSGPAYYSIPLSKDEATAGF